MRTARRQATKQKAQTEAETRGQLKSAEFNDKLTLKHTCIPAADFYRIICINQTEIQCFVAFRLVLIKYCKGEDEGMPILSYASKNREKIARQTGGLGTAPAPGSDPNVCAATCVPAHPGFGGSGKNSL